jgi:hypothetical protein
MILLSFSVIDPVLFIPVLDFEVIFLVQWFWPIWDNKAFGCSMAWSSIGR